MDIIPKDIQQYAETHTSNASALLQQIERETHLSQTSPHMLSGALQGRLLSMISKMVAPINILEIGTYTGYSALCLAEGLTAHGRLITLDINKELEHRTRDYFERANLSSAIDYRIGDAKDIIPTLNFPFDLVFIDADKENYLTYYKQVINKVPSGGYIIADNILWKGKVVGAKPDKTTCAIKQFNEEIDKDERVENMLLPIRDGLMLVRKK